MSEVAFFTEKQKELVRMLKNNELRRINLLYGSVRSGKTWITLVLFAVWVAQFPKDKTFIMCAKTLTTLKRNCLDLLQEIIGQKNFRYSLNSKTATLFGHKVYLEGANDSQSEGKIRGMTLQGAYVDEITLVAHDFFAMLLSRLSEPGAKLFGSTNPDNPGHWLKVEYINRASELDMYVGKFEIDDNTFLDPEYIRQIKSEYTGVFYDRFIRGEFAAGTGLIYPMYEEAVLAPPEGTPAAYVLSCDYGTQNAFAALLWGSYGGVWYAMREYYYSGRDQGKQKTDEEYAQDLDAWLADVMPGGQIKTIVDPSAASFITLLRKREHRYKTIPADNDVSNGIIETARAMHTGKIKISPACKNWHTEVQGYVWDEKSVEDRPVKIADHAMDAMRYAVFTMGWARKKPSYNSVFR